MTSFLPFWNKPTQAQDKEDPLFPSLTFKERVLAFLTCFVLGFAIFFGKTSSYMLCFSRNYVGNIIFWFNFRSFCWQSYSFCPQLQSRKYFIAHGVYNKSNFLIIFEFSSIGFLFGFKHQFKSMTDKTRLIACLIFIGSLIMTLVSALVFQKAFLVLIFVIIQVGAYIWYVASYIPFARDCLKSCIKRIANA